MNEAQTVGLDQRVRRLEIENRRWKLAGLAAVLIAGLAWITAADDPKAGEPAILRANQFILQDKEGKKRAWLDASTSDRPTLSFFDTKGRRTLCLAENEDGWTTMQLEHDGQPRFKAALSQSGSPLMTLLDQNTEGRIQLGLSGREAKPYLVLRDAEGDIRARFSLLGQDDNPSLHLIDGSAIPRMSLSLLGENSTPSLSLQDSKKKDRIGLSVFPDGTPRLYLQDQNEALRYESLLSPDGSPHQTFFGEKGKIRMRMGLFPGEIPGLALHDNAGRDRIGLSLEPDGFGSFWLYRPGQDENQNPSGIDLSMKPDGSGGLFLWSKKHDVRGSLSIDEHDQAGLVIGNPKNDSFLGILMRDGHPLLDVIGGHAIRASFGLNQANDVNFSIHGKDGPGGVKMRVGADGAPSVDVTDPKGESLLQVPKP